MIVRQSEPGIAEGLVAHAFETVPGCENACGHVVESSLTHGSVCNCYTQVARPVGTVRHSHIQTCLSTSNTGMLSDPIGHNKALEAKFVFQKLVHQMAILAAIAVVESLIAAHSGDGTSFHSILERPQIQLMHRLVIDIRRNRSILSGAETRLHAVRLLFVAEKMLDAGHDVLLHGNGGLVRQSSGQVWIVAEAFPVATASSPLAKRSNCWTECETDAFGFEFRPHVQAAIVGQVAIPGGSGMETRGISVDHVGTSDAIAGILKT